MSSNLYEKHFLWTKFSCSDNHQLTPPGTPPGLLQIPSLDKGGVFGMGLATPSVEN